MPSDKDKNESYGPEVSFGEPEPKSSEESQYEEEKKKLEAAGMGRKPPFMLNMPMPIVFAAGIVCELFSIITGATPMLNRDKAREAAGPDWTADASLWEKTAGWSDWTPLEQGVKLTFAENKNQN